MCKIYMLPPPSPKQQKNGGGGSEMKKKTIKKRKEKPNILIWKLFLGHFWFFKAQILAWNRKGLEEGVSCVIYWPEGPFLKLLTSFLVLTNQLWNRKIFLARFHILWLMVKVPMLGETAPIPWPYYRGQSGLQKEN